MRVPDVPGPLPDPRVHTWPAGDRIVRCHHISMDATEFNTSNVSRRFRPVTRGGDIVSTLYAADLPRGALSETVFHDVPVRGKYGGSNAERSFRWCARRSSPTVPSNWSRSRAPGSVAYG